MAWIRLSDTYIDHPKFLALSASAFRLWHEGIAFCRKHQTDGLISMSELQGFRYHQTARASELSKPHRAGAAPLWEAIDGFGYKVHDYLDWNPSKEEENERRAEAKGRMQAARDRRQRPGIPPRSHERTPNEQRTNGVRAQNVLRQAKTDQEEVKEFRRKENGATVFAGALPREHLNHEVCGRVCLHRTQFQRFTQKYGGPHDVASEVVRVWASSVAEEWNTPPKDTQPIGGNDFQFWDARWDEWQGPATKGTKSEADVFADLTAKGPSVRP